MHAVMDSPLGDLTLLASEGVLVGIRFGSEQGENGEQGERGERDDSAFPEVKRQLDEYFAGRRTRFDLPLPTGGDTFQERVWALLTEIPYGRTRSYGELARELGDPNLVRAVGAANGRNPLPVVVPCHRVIGADGSLTGYAGGLERKRFLLDLEEPGAEAAGRLF